ncbi:MAG: UTP--glucose-1-phosphate uridylyltransferase GalU [Candidatus Aminicenantia bacterium]
MIKKAVFPAGGLGTRFLPATKAQPKEMLPIIDKPLIQYGIEEVVSSGIENIIIVTSRGKNAIEDYFDYNKELELFLKERNNMDAFKEIQRISELINIFYVRQKNPLGLGHAVLMTKEMVGDEPFAVILADDVIDSGTPCIKQLINIFNEFKSSIIAIEEVPLTSVKNYGIIKGKKISERLFEIEDMVEKPSPSSAPSNLAIIGRYILTPKIFQKLSKTRPGAKGEIQLTDAIKALLSKEKVYGYQFEGKRYDAGDKLGFIKATIELSLKRKDIGEEVRAYLKNLMNRI